MVSKRTSEKEKPLQFQRRICQVNIKLNSQYYFVCFFFLYVCFFRYCVQDTVVLQKASESFRSLFMEVTDGICPFSAGLTIASVCNYFWRAKMLEAEKICLIPANGSITSGRQKSIVGTQWIKFMEMENNVMLKAEQRIGRWIVDGYDSASDTAYEFLGCMWHGCPKCLDPEVTHPFLNQPMAEVYRQTQDRLRDLRKLCANVIIVWEHEAKENMEFQIFASSCELVDDINIRDAFFGGRTDATKLHHYCTVGEQIR
jgi:hypothetical protein